MSAEDFCRYCGAPRREGTGLFMCGEGIAHHVEGGCRHDDTAAWIRACVARAEAAEQRVAELEEALDTLSRWPPYDGVLGMCQFARAALASGKDKP